MAHNNKVFNRIKPKAAKRCSGGQEEPNRALPVPNKKLKLDAKQIGGIMEVLLDEPNSPVKEVICLDD